MKLYCMIRFKEGVERFFEGLSFSNWFFIGLDYWSINEIHEVSSILDNEQVMTSRKNILPRKIGESKFTEHTNFQLLIKTKEHSSFFTSLNIIFLTFSFPIF